MSATAAPTPEELKAEHEKAVKAISDSMFNTTEFPVGGRRKKAPKEAPPAEPPKETPPAEPPPATPPAEPPKEPETPPAEPPKDKPPETPPAAPAKPAAAPEPSLARLPKRDPALDKDAIKEVVEQTLEEAGVKPTALPPVQPGPMLGAKEQKMVEVFQKMEALNPAYKGLAGKVVAFWSREEAWIADWEQKNPDKEFSDDNEEYAAFLKKNEPQYDEDDYEAAKEALIEERVTAKVETKTQAKARELDAKQRAVQERPVIEQLAHNTVAQMVANTFVGADGKLPEEVAAILLKEGNLVIDDAAAAKLMEYDPTAYQALLEDGEELHMLVHALETMARGLPVDNLRRPVRLKISGRVISPMSQLDVEADEIEREMLKMPKEELKDSEGRAFVSIDRWNAEMDKINKLPADKQRAALDRLNQSYWHLGPDEIRVGLAGKFAGKVKNRIAVLNDVLDRKAKKQKPSAPAETPKADSAPPTEPVPGAAKTKSPATVSRSDTPDRDKGPTISKEQKLEEIHTSMWG